MSCDTRWIRTFRLDTSFRLGVPRHASGRRADLALQFIPAGVSPERISRALWACFIPRCRARTSVPPQMRPYPRYVSLYATSLLYFVTLLIRPMPAQGDLSPYGI